MNYIKNFLTFICVFLITLFLNTCALSFSGEQNVSFVEEDQAFSDNESSSLDLNSVDQHRQRSLLNGNRLGW